MEMWSEDYEEYLFPELPSSDGASIQPSRVLRVPMHGLWLDFAAAMVVDVELGSNLSPILMYGDVVRGL